MVTIWDRSWQNGRRRPNYAIVYAPSRGREGLRAADLDAQVRATRCVSRHLSLVTRHCSLFRRPRTPDCLSNHYPLSTDHCSSKAGSRGCDNRTGLRSSCSPLPRKTPKPCFARKCLGRLPAVSRPPRAPSGNRRPPRTGGCASQRVPRSFAATLFGVRRWPNGVNSHRFSPLWVRASSCVFVD